MKHTYFEVPLYGYNGTFISLDGIDVQDGCDKGLEDIGLDREIRDIINEDCEKGIGDGAVTFHNKNKHEIVTVFYPMYSRNRANECAMHELFHIVSDISKHCDIDVEASAYMQGYIGTIMLGFLFNQMYIIEQNNKIG